MVATRAVAHRLDEYLQYTILSVEPTRVKAEISLTPGVATCPVIIALIDTNGDGILSNAEQRAYAARVLDDISLSVDGQSLRPRLVGIDFPTVAEMREGQGEIRLQIDADVPAAGAARELRLENRHQSGIAAYLVNCLVPQDRGIRIISQQRNESQSQYELQYTQAQAGASAPKP